MVDEVCAVPYRHERGEVEVLLVTSRKKGYWIFPKGQRLKGRPLSITAALEAWEEAGVRGRAERRPVALYQRASKGTLTFAEVYLFLVEEVAGKWPEKGERQRQWVPIRKARKLVKGRHIRELMPRIEREIRKRVERSRKWDRNPPESPPAGPPDAE